MKSDINPQFVVLKRNIPITEMRIMLRKQELRDQLLGESQVTGMSYMVI
jgi:hypothetical protein